MQAVRNLQIIASDVTTVVSGQVVDENGRPRPDAVVVVFPADPGLWVSYSRHVRRSRPDLDGDYRIRGLPPGEYLILATDEVSESDLLDAELLEWLRAPADRLTLGAGDTLTRDLRVKHLRLQTGIAGDPAAWSTRVVPGVLAWPPQHLAGLGETPDTHCGRLGGP
jgi:protocatechuate 3,4-dioxygenase beta subunit